MSKVKAVNDEQTLWVTIAVTSIVIIVAAIISHGLNFVLLSVLPFFGAFGVYAFIDKYRPHPIGRWRRRRRDRHNE